MKSEKIREIFLDFFRKKNHKIIKSSSIIIKDDPTLMFTNAGMNQFKDFFLGYKEPIYQRIANTQKCLRIMGKHDDLNNVGYDGYHHTMFEMLGNWSFNDGFSKKDAINWSWELLTKKYKISKNNLYVTIFKGDNDNGLSLDYTSRDIWLDIIDKNHIFFDKKNNFWEMGEFGLCGPCCEIHIDLRNEYEKNKIHISDLINKNHPDVIEIWNLVFIEFFRKKNGILEKLPKKHIDTGIGFERLCRIIQNKKSNYETDLFYPIIKNIELYTNNIYGLNSKIDIAIRIISDHVRAISFAIADGQIFSNNGPGYVIKKILRRALVYSYNFLNNKNPIIYKLVPILSSIMKNSFPEIEIQKEFVKKIIKEEEESFLKNIHRGFNYTKKVINNLNKKNENIISGDILFKLYDTYGFPIDLSKNIAKKNGLTLDYYGFKNEMLKQKNRSKLINNIERYDWIIINNDLIDKLEDNFIGYKQLKITIKIVKYRLIKSHNKKNYYEIVFNKTPFFPESGGQIGDVGIIKSLKEKINILKTKKENNLICHVSIVEPKYPHEIFSASVDKIARKKIEKNHTATHLLNYALKKILGKHIEQRGSYINSKYLRFDFSHAYKLNKLEIFKIEENVNKIINRSLSIKEINNISIEEAAKIGAKSIFSEKYNNNKIRVICFGNSIELCIGTHVENTNEIQFFKIIKEYSIASGIRRIEAITSKEVEYYLNNNNEKYISILEELNNPINPIKIIQNIKLKNNKFKIYINKLKTQTCSLLKENLKLNLIKTKYANLILYNIIYDIDIKLVKNVVLDLIKNINNIFILLFNQINNKEVIIYIIISGKIFEKIKIKREYIIKKLNFYFNEIKIIDDKLITILKGNISLDIKNIIEKFNLYLKSIL